jgi:hypothetical protein
MENKIKEVQQYFLDKIVAGDYEVKSSLHPNYVEIQIDGQYNYTIWIGSGVKFVSIWNTGFIALPLFTPEQQEAVHANISIYIKERRDENRRLRIDALQAELKQLERAGDAK